MHCVHAGEAYFMHNETRRVISVERNKGVSDFVAEALACLGALDGSGDWKVSG